MSQRKPPPEGLPPHPDLERYYRPGEKKTYVRSVFDASAPDYERVEKLMSLGTGSWYRRRALRRHGLPCGSRVLDVAVGTGLVAREIRRLSGDGRLLVGLDPSLGMLSQAKARSPVVAVAGVGERLPFEREFFDCLTMGYALRHLPDLMATFREFYRVLRPSGRILILEITPPRRGLGKLVLKAYIRTLTATAALVVTRHRSTAELWRYFWDTMEACVPPETVCAALVAAGFDQVSRFVELGIFSEYTAVKPS
ncbi:MAG: class I SAM-dependent methyltransferase [Thermoanaerobaculum sp.]